MSGDSERYIAALDIGTTTIKCHIYDSNAVVRGHANCKVNLYYPKPGWVEIDPDRLFSNALQIIKKAVEDANVSYLQIKSIGISTLRGTFITWKKDTGHHLHNFITWKDLRAAELLNNLNSSWSSFFLRWSATFLYLLTRNKKFGMGSKFKIACNHVSGRFLWVLSNIKEVTNALNKNNLMFGTMETWLIFKLTGGKTYVTDITNASATGFYDPFDMNWGIIAKLLRIPIHILPEVVDNDYNFGAIDEDFFGVPIKIGCVIADQSASMFGNCCFHENDLKVTIGTGAFLDVNTSSKVCPSLNHINPLVGWCLGGEIVYMSEIQCLDAGSFIEWIQRAGFIDDPSVTSRMASEVLDNDGVYFIPAFSGLGPPINDESATAGFIGIKPTTNKQHLVRAILESIVYQIVLSYDLLKEERRENYKTIFVDGGLSRNDFICQKLADLLYIPIERTDSVDLSVKGTAYLAGLSCGMWKSKDDLYSMRRVERIFKPSKTDNLEKCRHNLHQWILAVDRFKSWY